MSDLLFLVPFVVAGSMYTMMRLMLVIAPSKHSEGIPQFRMARYRHNLMLQALVMLVLAVAFLYVVSMNMDALAGKYDSFVVVMKVLWVSSIVGLSMMALLDGVTNYRRDLERMKCVETDKEK